MKRWFFALLAFITVGTDGIYAGGRCDSPGRSNFPAFSPEPTTTPFTQFYREVINGDFVASATSLWNGSGSITVSGIPAGATVLSAYLFYSYQDNGGGHTGNFNGNPISGTFLGSDCTSCWGTSSTSLYYADVTPYVTGNGTYSLSGFDALACASGDHGAEGATLVVIYCDPSEPKRAITIYTGVWETYCSGWSYNWDHTGFTATSPVTSAKYSVSIGNGQNFGESSTEYVRINGNTVATDVDGSVPPSGGPCGNGSLWDHFQGDATAFIPSSATSVNFRVDNNAASDCWHPVLSVLSLTVTDSITQTCSAGYDDPVMIRENRIIPRSNAIYSVYTPSGVLIYRGKGTYTLKPGIYFVVAEGRSRKVIVR